MMAAVGDGGSRHTGIRERMHTMAVDPEGDVRTSVLVWLRMVVGPEKRDELVHTMRGEMGPTRTAAGCCGCSFWQDTEDENVFLLAEEWESWDCLVRHISRDRNFRLLLAVMDLLREAPDVRIHRISGTSGLDSLMQARVGGGLPTE